MQKLPLVVLLSFTSVPVWADLRMINANSQYQFELSGWYGEDNDLYPEPAQTYGVKGTYYFTPVWQSDHPYAEAAFLERASSVSLSARRWDDSDQYPCGLDATGLCHNEYLEDKILLTGSWYSAGWLFVETTYFYEQTDNRWRDDREASFDRNSWSAQIGITPLAGLRVSTGYSEENDLGENDWNVEAKYVASLSDTQAINVELAYEYAEDDEWMLAGDYYLTQAFSIGGGLATNDDYLWRSRYFVTDFISVDVSYYEYEDGDAYQVRVSTRF
ncbi:putative porin [Gilvimarinus chinensis]|uniref:putative porin n=1 Tax=Gilvimarinus chinensis TaxID=396005 RepID=UPI000A059BA0|nr:putative porin [Gilvimarinus chinensis]